MGLFTIFIFILFFIFIYFFVATLSLTIRRLHDTGRSHLHATPIFLFGFLGNLVTEIYGPQFAVVLNIVQFLGGIYLLILMFFKSQPDTNEWGDATEGYFGFLSATRNFFINYSDFKSRSRRSEYWWAIAPQIIFYLIITQVVINL